MVTCFSAFCRKESGLPAKLISGATTQVWASFRVRSLNTLFFFFFNSPSLNITEHNISPQVEMAYVLWLAQVPGEQRVSTLLPAVVSTKVYLFTSP